LHILIYCDNRWSSLLKQFIPLIFTLDRLMCSGTAWIIFARILNVLIAS